MLADPQTKAEMIARYKAARGRLGVKPYQKRPDKAPPVVPPPLVVVDAPPLRQMGDTLKLTTYGAWIINPAPPPLIPYHLQNRIKRIQQITARRMGVSVHDMLSARRNAHIALARQIAMWVCKEKTAHSYPDIGKQFGGRDHTTALHAWRKIERLRFSDPWIADHLAKIVEAL